MNRIQTLWKPFEFAKPLRKHFMKNVHFFSKHKHRTHAVWCNCQDYRTIATTMKRYSKYFKNNRISSDSTEWIQSIQEKTKMLCFLCLSCCTGWTTATTTSREEKKNLLNYCLRSGLLRLQYWIDFAWHTHSRLCCSSNFSFSMTQ